MKTKTLIQRLSGGLCLAGCLLLVGAGNASEPDNNDAVWQGGITFAKDVTLYSTVASTYYRQWNNAESISPSGDVDVLYMECRGAPVQQVGLQEGSGTGDLDMAAYDTSGDLLGYSHHTNGWENIVVSSLNRPVVVIEVAGLNWNDTGSYSPRLDCSP